MTTDLVASSYDEEMLDSLAREMYHMRSNSPEDMTDERWERIKRMFPGSVRVCREDVIRFHPELVTVAQPIKRADCESA